MTNKKGNKTKMVNEKVSRKLSKVNMEAAEDMDMPNTDKKKKQGEGSSKNQFR